MKYIISITIFVCLSFIGKTSFGQEQAPVDTVPDRGFVTVQKDLRLDILGKKMAEYNTKQTVTKVGGYASGYRLMVVNTNDRNYAMQVRTYLLQKYPDQQVHMTFVNPYIKLKFGDFVDRNDAVKVRNDLVKSNLIKGNIYIVPEQVIVKKSKEDEETD